MTTVRIGVQFDRRAMTELSGVRFVLSTPGAVVDMKHGGSCIVAEHRTEIEICRLGRWS